jgi:hypothetical protein
MILIQACGSHKKTTPDPYEDFPKARFNLPPLPKMIWPIRTLFVCVPYTHITGKIPPV